MKKCKNEDLKKGENYGIGGADVAACMGLSRWKSRHQLWLEKTGQSAQDEQVKDEKFSRYWGTVIEDNIAREFSKQTGYKVKRCNFLLKHELHDFMVARIDREGIDENGEKFVLECTSTYSFNKNWNADEIPYEKELQLLHYLMITGYKYGFIACLVGNSKFLIKKIELEDEIKKAIMDAEVDFWYYVQSKEMPPVDYSEACRATLESMYPKALNVSQPIKLDQACEDKLKQRDSLLCQVENINQQIRAVDNFMKDTLKANQAGKTDTHLVTWKNVTQQRFDVCRFKEMHPDLYKDFLFNVDFRKYNVQHL